jgi:hypothetical protein
VTLAPIDRLRKPTVRTKFHIDFQWWEQEGREFWVDVLSHLSPEYREEFSSHPKGEIVDAVDPVTAEVHRVDRLQYTLGHRCVPLDPFMAEHSLLVDIVFHVFLTNGNKALTAEELAEQVKRPAATILRTLGGHVVYKGLRPLL